MQALTRRVLLVGAGAGALSAWGGAAAAQDTLNGEALKQVMMDRLGVRSLRPGPSGDPAAPNHANYDEALAGPIGDLPDPLRLADGRPVRDAATWWRLRRPQIVEAFEREVYGRVPTNAPTIRWRMASERQETLAGVPVRWREMVGVAENRAWPAVEVAIRMTVVTPAAARRPVPLLVMFSTSEFKRPGPSPSPAQADLLNGGWGYATLDTATIQPDKADGLTGGIIGLCARGGSRAPDEWGALRAWAWGASRAFDHLARDSAVDARRIGVEGVSRWGKAALVTGAFDRRFAVVLVGSSGKGGATLHRRNFGEAVESLTGGEWYWLAGNYLKYGADETPRGRMDARDLPVDSHELIALCAPRPTFISYGSPEHGDAPWLDQRGSWMATVAAGRVFRLLGACDLGVGDDWRHTPMPPILTPKTDGELAWLQHDGGHTDAPNIAAFIAWADRLAAKA